MQYAPGGGGVASGVVGQDSGVVVVVVCLNRCVVQSRFLGSKKLNSLIDSTGLSHKFTVDKSLG